MTEPDTQERQRFYTHQDWYTFINSFSAEKPLTSDIINKLRYECYEEIETERGNPLIAYLSQIVGAPKGTNIIDLNEISKTTNIV